MNPANVISIADLQRHLPVRALLVDDSPFMRAFLAIFLEDAGIEVVGTAADGCQALQSVAALKPDLVLMDVDMPRMNGIEATRSIKEAGQHSGDAPVIVIVTSEDTLECRSQAEDAGADGFVSKSDDLRGQLNATLDNLFSWKREALAAALIHAGHESPSR
jgi:CheY-like chemotaxis protein